MRLEGWARAQTEPATDATDGLSERAASCVTSPPTSGGQYYIRPGLTDNMRQRRRPTTRNAARALGAGPDQLRHFVAHHPDPTAEALLAATATDADALDRPERELVGEWIQQQKHTQRRTAKDELYEFVRDGGPARQERILREAENASPALLLSLASEGVLVRETPGDPRQTPPDEWIYRAVQPPEDYHPVD